MDIKLLNLSYELKELINNDERIILLNKLENEMNNNDEVILLAYQKDMMAINLSDLLKIYNEEDEHVIEARKKLHTAKMKLDNHELVKAYNKAYKDVRMMLDEVNSILFDDLKMNSCPAKK